MKQADILPEMEVMPVAALPAVMRGVDEVVAVLGASEGFVRTWMDMGEGTIPAMPSYQMGGNRVFPTGRVVRWLEEYFFYGDGGRPVSQRPQERRGGPGKRKGKQDLAAKERKNHI